MARKSRKKCKCGPVTWDGHLKSCPDYQKPRKKSLLDICFE